METILGNMDFCAFMFKIYIPKNRNMHGCIFSILCLLFTSHYVIMLYMQWNPSGHP